MSDDSSAREEANFLGELRRAIRDTYVNAAGTFVIVTAGLYLATVAAFNRSVCQSASSYRIPNSFHLQYIP